ncbi:LysR family transcriptional regulator|uniref:DNA-binding transcriptional regulator, LysR family n=1 Tax=Dendrosporobacter quercicolus TaxID=146817 RepID=A0A1G9X7J8_9FIRM|nr:LysR family transcriptional regulator [Dendrosporobacter quercicolus]NSL49924.1 LysR family transcriptional regulator [Dendrosporobacter quercicolus DSM 1736]SDM92730.1 DNA-binding transcriptional regulator, LysR family [Dendrosporobacter quercicolus]
MNSKELHYVVTIAEERSITNAANKLFVSQSTLSHSLAKLEERLGIPLFDRSTIPLKPTLAGELFVNTANKIFQLDRELQQQIQDVANFKHGSFTIGVTHLAERSYLPLVLPRFYKKYPGISIILKVAGLNQLETMLLKNMVDFAIIIPLDNPSIEYKPIFTMNVLIAMPLSHPLAKKHSQTGSNYPEIDLTELKNEDFILLPQGRKLRETILTACKAAGFSPKISLEVSNLDTAHALVAEGYGVTFIMDIITRNDPKKDKIAYFKIKNTRIQQTFCLGYLKKKYLPKAIDEFLYPQDIQV